MSSHIKGPVRRINSILVAIKPDHSVLTKLPREGEEGRSSLSQGRNSYDVTGDKFSPRLGMRQIPDEGVPYVHSDGAIERLEEPIIARSERNV